MEAEEESCTTPRQISRVSYLARLSAISSASGERQLRVRMRRLVSQREIRVAN